MKPEIQNLYDRLSLIYSSCRWIGESIEILEEYIVDPPYDKVAVLPGKDGTGIERMRKIVSEFSPIISARLLPIFCLPLSLSLSPCLSVSLSPSLSRSWKVSVGS